MAPLEQPASAPQELLVRPLDGGRTVAFQWTDGAGELQYWSLSIDQSRAYLLESTEELEV
jgi:hypothetical protein